MASFTYNALDAEGRVVKGRQDAETADDVVEALAARGLIAIDIAEAERAIAKGVSGVKPAQVTQFLSDLATMLGAGIRLDEALQLIEKEMEAGKLRQVVRGVLTEVSAGAAFSDALAPHEALFPSYQVAMVKVGEASGTLGGVVARIVEERVRFEKLKAGVFDALRYPAVLMLGTIAVMIFFLIGVVPQFEPIIAGRSDAEGLKTVLGFSKWVREHADWIGAGLGAALIGLLLAGRHRPTRARLTKSMLALPGIRPIATSYRAARFTRLLAVMMETGVQVPVALGLLGEALDPGDPEGQTAAATAAVRRGERLSTAIGDLGLPPLAIRLLRLGEETGKLAALSARTSEFYEGRLERQLQRVIGIIGPFAILFLSLVIGGVIVAMMSTLLSFNDVL